jgi:hypothetical protein
MVNGGSDIGSSRKLYSGEVFDGQDWHLNESVALKKTGTRYPYRKKCTKWTQNVPNGHKISQMSVKYSEWP